MNVTVQGRDAVGALAGSVEANGSIKGSTVTGLIGGRFYVGGVAGENHGLIELSHSESTVVGTVDPQGYGNIIGGLVGSANCLGREDTQFARERKCERRRRILVVWWGSTEASIYYSHAQSTVSGHDAVGGLAGSNFGFISGSYSAGAVSGTENVGGLVGFHDCQFHS